MLSGQRHVRLTVFFSWCSQTPFDYPVWAKWVFAHVPFAMRAYRAFLLCRVSRFGYLCGHLFCVR